MSALLPVPPFGLVFPDSDGQPMAENTRQYEAIVTLKGNIEAFAPDSALVAGDHLIYVNAGDPRERQAPARAPGLATRCGRRPASSRR